MIRIHIERVRAGRCVCCGFETEDFTAIAEGVKMCHEYCIEPGHDLELRPGDHRVYITSLLYMLDSELRDELAERLGSG